MAKRRQHSLNRRNAGKRPTRDRILIITEGETEANILMRSDGTAVYLQLNVW